MRRTRAELDCVRVNRTVGEPLAQLEHRICWLSRRRMDCTWTRVFIVFHFKFQVPMVAPLLSPLKSRRSASSSDRTTWSYRQTVDLSLASTQPVGLLVFTCRTIRWPSAPWSKWFHSGRKQQTSAASFRRVQCQWSFISGPKNEIDCHLDAVHLERGPCHCAHLRNSWCRHRWRYPSRFFFSRKPNWNDLSPRLWPCTNFVLGQQEEVPGWAVNGLWRWTSAYCSDLSRVEWKAVIKTCHLAGLWLLEYRHIGPWYFVWAENASGLNGWLSLRDTGQRPIRLGGVWVGGLKRSPLKETNQIDAVTLTNTQKGKKKEESAGKKKNSSEMGGARQ